MKRNPSCKLRNAFNHLNRKWLRFFISKPQTGCTLQLHHIKGQQIICQAGGGGGFNAVINNNKSDFKPGVLDYTLSKNFQHLNITWVQPPFLLCFMMLFPHDNLSVNQTDPDIEIQAVTLWFPVWGKDSIWQEMMQQHSWQEQDRHSQKSLKDFFFDVAAKQCSMCVYKKQ